MTDADAIVELAWMYMQANKLQRAEEVIRSGLAADPHHPQSLSALARIKLRQGDFVAAEDAARAALNVVPHYEYAMDTYARALHGQDRLADALAMARDTVAHHPHSASAHQCHAELLLEAGRPREARRAVEEALRLDPHDVDAMVLRADVLLFYFHTDGNQAVAGYRQALRVQPDHAGAVHGLAKVYALRRQNWRAIYGSLSVGRLAPDEAEVVRHNVGVVLTSVLRKSSWLVLVVAVAVVAARVLHTDGDSTALARTVAGLGAAHLLLTHTRLRHGVLPRQTRKTLMRQHTLLAVRSVMLFAGVVVGAQTALLGPMLLPTLLAVLLMVAVPTVLLIATVTGELRPHDSR
ncbi:hypothetical protein CIW49_26740 [Mycolicibacterium sp. P1-18]|uniref:tetratricopeptide repeat protein n=1 Tax=Mycolicibacterium sp. P1-18 TaxID=2024615 RepID=UPI0011F1D56F|nr:tetratricopeptide repeat protein [Mycolicibacterium sp. P1-18]KAA0093648.1 hypothetical protein CIW49_26740 [Mycolicibacterium sp. P1-18]